MRDNAGAVAVRRAQRLVACADGCRGRLSAAAILHIPAQGERADEGNVEKMMRCAVHAPAMLWLAARPGYMHGLTAGALELAGIALSFQLIKNYAAALRGGTGSQHSGLGDPAYVILPGDLVAFVYSDDVPVVHFAIEGGGAALAGARHLEGLAAHVHGLWQGLNLDPAFQYVQLGWAPRESVSIRGVARLAREGFGGEAWPDGLLQLLSDSSEEFLAASPAEQRVMFRF